MDLWRSSWVVEAVELTVGNVLEGWQRTHLDMEIDLADVV